MSKIDIEPLHHLSPGIFALEQAAQAEGFRFISRLISEWQSGVQRFDAPGACLLAAYLDGKLVAVGGLTPDPYAHEADTGRIRRLYVTPTARGRQIGQTLLQRLLAHAGPHFSLVRVLTDTTAGDAFYLRCGFQRIKDPHSSHALRLSLS